MGQGDALLWRLELNSTASAKGPIHSYLFGTMHSAASSAIDKSIGVLEYIDQCTNYFGETDLESELFTQIQAKEIKQWDGLQNNMNPSAYRKIRHILNIKSGIDLNHIQSMPPLILQTYIGEHLMGSQTSHLPLDMLLWNHAKKANKQLGGIESAADQAGIYRKIPLKFQKKQLKDAVLHLSRTVRHLTNLTKAYNKEELTRLFKLSKPSLGPVKALLLTNRNKVMAERIYEILKMDQTSFIAIGAAHLPGLNGILRLLKRKGVQLKSIKP